MRDFHPYLALYTSWEDQFDIFHVLVLDMLVDEKNNYKKKEKKKKKGNQYEDSEHYATWNTQTYTIYDKAVEIIFV